MDYKIPKQKSKTLQERGDIYGNATSVDASKEKEYPVANEGFALAVPESLQIMIIQARCELAKAKMEQAQAKMEQPQAKVEWTQTKVERAQSHLEFLQAKFNAGSSAIKPRLHGARSGPAEPTFPSASSLESENYPLSEYPVAKEGFTLAVTESLQIIIIQARCELAKAKMEQAQAKMEQAQAKVEWTQAKVEWAQSHLEFLEAKFNAGSNAIKPRLHGARSGPSEPTFPSASSLESENYPLSNPNNLHNQVYSTSTERNSSSKSSLPHEQIAQRREQEQYSANAAAEPNFFNSPQDSYCSLPSTSDMQRLRVLEHPSDNIIGQSTFGIIPLQQLPKEKKARYANELKKQVDENQMRKAREKREEERRKPLEESVPFSTGCRRATVKDSVGNIIGRHLMSSPLIWPLNGNNPRSSSVRPSDYIYHTKRETWAVSLMSQDSSTTIAKAEDAAKGSLGPYGTYRYEPEKIQTEIERINKANYEAELKNQIMEKFHLDAERKRKQKFEEEKEAERINQERLKLQKEYQKEQAKLLRKQEEQVESQITDHPLSSLTKPHLPSKPTLSPIPPTNTEALSLSFPVESPKTSTSHAVPRDPKLGDLAQLRQFMSKHSKEYDTEMAKKRSEIQAPEV